MNGEKRRPAWNDDAVLIRIRTAARVAGFIACLASFALIDSHETRPSRGAQAQPIELPTEWHISPATGLVKATGTLPVSATQTADGKHVIVVDAGAGAPQIQILDASTFELERTIPMKGVYGVPLPDPSGSGFFVSTAASAAIEHIDAATGTADRTIAMPDGSWPASIARSTDGDTLAVSDETGARLSFVDLRDGSVKTTVTFGAHLADAVWARDGKTVYVASWGGSSVFAIDAATRSVRSEIPSGRHPEHLALAPDGTQLYVSEPDDDAIGVIDPNLGKLVRTIPIGLFSARLSGASPTSIAIDPTGRRLYVTCSAANVVAVLDTSKNAGDAAFVGAIPTGWYPTFVALDSSNAALVVADGMGEGGRANPQYRPFEKRSPTNTGYIASSMIGSIRRIAIPADAELAAGIQTALNNGGPYLHSWFRGLSPTETRHMMESSGAGIVRPNGPIRHVIYIIKENRTYDQVLGDEATADGNPALTLFGREITPNEHAISERFGIFDRTFADAEVSADGHNWSTAAFANDYLEKMWPQVYGGRRDTYDFEDGATASTPHGGYLWNDAKRFGISLRNYGEFTTEPDERQPVAGEKASDVHAGITSSMSDLKDETDPKFPGFDLGVSDLTRFAEWKREYEAYESSGSMPAIELMRFPNDHTAGTRKGDLTPAAFNAQNDDAVGRLVDVVSHGKYWSSTAIFIVEDDAQNGADHVDAQRMTFYLASPYAAGGVRHAHYSTAGVLHTIEIIFGLSPMSTYDAAALPLFDAFTSAANFAPYDARPETHSEMETNGAAAYHVRENARYDLTREDVFPSGEMNDEIWHAVTGHAAPRVPRGSVAAR